MPWKSAAAGGSVHRPRTGSRSIRGQISGPFPIRDPFDDEVPKRDLPSTANDGVLVDHVVMNVADNTIPRHTEGNPDQAGTRYASASSGSTDNYTFQSQMMDATSSVAARTSMSQKSCAKAPSQVRQSNPLSDTPIRRDGRNSQVQPQRKKSSIRSALGKMFGRKNKNRHKDEAHGWPSRKTISAESDNAPHEQHGSVGGSPRRTLGNTTKRVSKQDSTDHRPPPPQFVGESNRSCSMPITEYDRALRSHSIGPEDVMAIQSARNSLSADVRLSGKCVSLFDSSPHPGSPRWTTGSRLAGLAPRPASSQDRTFVTNVNEDPRDIGRAISSESNGLKRRSRSLTFTPGSDIAWVSSVPRGMVRRRSAEIRYWRDGHAAALRSPTSTAADKELTQLPLEARRKPEPDLEVEVKAEAKPELEARPKSTSPDSSPVVEERAVTPSQPAAFYQQEDDGREKDRSKSSARSTERTSWIEQVSIESRVSSLETRMSRLEGIVLQLGNSLSVLRQPNKESRLSGSRQVRGQTGNHEFQALHLQSSEIGFLGEQRHSVSRLSTCHSNTSQTTFGEVGEVTPRATVVSPTISSSQQQRGVAEETAGCPAADTTTEKFTSLLALLEAERSAREALEAQVRSLGRQMHLISKSVAYTSTDQSDSPSLNRSLGEVSVFDHDDEDDRRRLIALRYPYNPLGLEDSGIATDLRSDDEYTESFATPAETASSGLDAFDNENEANKLQSSTKESSLSRPTTRQ